MIKPFDEDKIFSVTEISLVIKEMLEGVLNGVRVEGEISNLKKASSGHMYFDIKDNGALISAVLFKGYAFKSDRLEEGAKVVIDGDISCYIKQGRYQIIARQVTVTSKGDLYAEFEKLKAKLSAEGLFDQSRKKVLPRFPSRIGVITSPTGAAVRDILSILKRRGRNLEVILAPVLVQGEGSKEQIVEALKNLNKLTPAVDVILLGRGGGSIEDLWSFNEELVVRAVAASKIPTISCVGHETDFTLTDFAADLRAATPSAAAELVIENSQNTIKHLTQLNKILAQSVGLIYERLKARYEQAVNNKIFKEPALIFLKKEQEIDELKQNLYDAIEAKIKQQEQKLALLNQRITLLNPQAVLKRGYSITRRVSDGSLALSSLKGERLRIQTAQDTFEVETI